MYFKVLETERLRLRQWDKADYQPFATINADPEVMAYFPTTLSSPQSDVLAARCAAQIAGQGWGLWAVALKESNTFIGFTGLNQADPRLPFSPCTEIAWRLGRTFWGQGYATEAATAALNFAFTRLGLSEIVSFTAAVNQRSIAVMKRLEMTDTRQNFPHPALPREHPLTEHVLYRICAE